MVKIINYLLYVSKNIDNINIENNRECLFKVLDYLKEFKMDNPISYLKVIYLNKIYFNIPYLFISYLNIANKLGNND